MTDTTTTTKETTIMTTICGCGTYCLNTTCTSSDSGKTVRRCWCVECNDRRAEVKAAANRTNWSAK